MHRIHFIVTLLSSVIAVGSTLLSDAAYRKAANHPAPFSLDSWAFMVKEASDVSVEVVFVHILEVVGSFANI